MARIKEKIEDFGEKIGGAKKDYYAQNGIKVEDLEDLNHRQLIEHTIKSNLIKKPDYVQLVESGMPKETVYFMKKVYDSFPTKFDATGKDFSEDKARATNYIQLGQVVNEVFNNVKSIDDFEKIKKALIDNGYVYVRGYNYYGTTEKAKHIELKKFFKSLYVSSYDKRMAQTKIAETNFPHGVESWRRGYAVKKAGESWCVCKKESGRYLIVSDYFKSEEQAEKHLTEVIKPQVEAKKNKSKNIIEPRPQLKHIVRRGQSYRDSQNITTDQFQNTFGFRGGEFGNWNNQDDRQQNLNLAYDSLIDLASILKVSPDAISLGNTLAIAFGSRGSGRALAHYEPGSVVINLTKLRGAGSLSHEWGHALDDYLSRLSGNTKFNVYMSGGINVNTSKIPDTAKAFNELMNQIKKKVLNEEEIEKKYQGEISDYHEKIKSEILERVKRNFNIDVSKYQDILSDGAEIRLNTFNSMVNEIESNGNSISDFIRNKFDRFNFAIGELQTKIENRKELVGSVIDETDFLKAAKHLDETRSKDYFSTDKELFARAFESYIEYKIKNADRKSDYLVYGTGYLPLYVGGKREQELIFSKFDKLFDVIKELDKSSLVEDSYKLIEDSYENKDFKDKKVENSTDAADRILSETIPIVETAIEDIKPDPLDYIDSNSEFRILMDDQINIVKTIGNSNYVDVVKFNSDEKFLSLENSDKETIKSFVSQQNLNVTENINDRLKLKASEILESKDYSNVIKDIDNLLITSTDGIIISQKSLDKFHISMYDENLKYVGHNTLFSSDELKSLLLKSSIIEIGEASAEFLQRDAKNLLEFKNIKEQIDQFKYDECFEVEFKDKTCEVNFNEKDNLYEIKSLTTKEAPEFLQEHELISKLIDEKPLEIREGYIKKIEREMAEESERATGILEELKKADSFVLKNNEGSKHVLVTPSLRESGSIQITYMENEEPISHATELSKEAAALRLAEEGFSKQDIKDKVKIEELKVEGVKEVKDIPILTGNISLNDLKAKGDIHVIRLNNNNLDKLKNMNQEFTSFKNKDYTSVIVLKSELDKALVSLGFKNQEISKIPYGTFKTLPGMNKYILMSNEEFERIKSSNINYSAFVKPNGINVVIKEKDLKTSLSIIERNVEQTLGNIVYKELKDQGDLKHIQFDRKIAIKVMDKLMDEDVKFSAFYKGESNVNIAFNKKDIEKFNNILSKVKLELSRPKQTER